MPFTGTELAGNWIVEGTSTQGTGQLNLNGADFGYITFAKALPSGGRVFYTIFNGDNREAGIGEINANILTRLHITATLNNGIYNEGTNLQPINLVGDSSVAGTFNQAAFEHLWKHVFDLDNPHDVQAFQVDYNNSQSGLVATNVQSAIDELYKKSEDHEGDLNNPHQTNYLNLTDTDNDTYVDQYALVPTVNSTEDGLEFTEVTSTWYGDLPPTDTAKWKRWWDTENGRAFVWYQDASSSQWVVEDPQAPLVAPRVDSIKWYDPAKVFEPKDFCFYYDERRADTWISLFQNQTNAPITGPWDQSLWTPYGSYYTEVFGLGFTQSGLLSGGSMVKAGATAVFIAGGSGLIMNKLNLTAPTTQRITWLPQALSLNNIATDEFYFIVIDANGNAQALASPSLSAFKNNILLGTVGRDPTNPAEVGEVNNRPVATQSLSDSVLEIQKLFLNNKIIAGGLFDAAANDLTMQVNEARIYAFGTNFRADPANPNEVNIPPQDPLSFLYTDRDFYIGTAVTDVDPGNWDNAGTIEPVPDPDAATIQLLYHNMASNQFFLIYGQQVYIDLDTAEGQTLNYGRTVELPKFAESTSVFFGFICVKNGATDLSDSSQARFIPAAGVSVAGAGGAVTGLGSLADVTLTIPKVRQQLTYNSVGEWVNQDPNTVGAIINQVGHNFVPSEMIYFDGTQWAGAQADAVPTLAQAMVVDILSVDEFYLVYEGGAVIPGHGYTVGSTYYLDNATAGGVTETLPTTDYTQAVFEVLDANTLKLLNQAVINNTLQVLP